tara:strand:- start:2158 stop:2448 length:291 start_codon:yes stop_codon:yes gene_type:complete
MKAEILLIDDEGNRTSITIHPEDGSVAQSLGDWAFSGRIVKLTKEYRDEQWLRNAYLVEGRSMADIASEQGITPMAVRDWLLKFGIETRARGRRKE